MPRPGCDTGPGTGDGLGGAIVIHKLKLTACRDAQHPLFSGGGVSHVSDKIGPCQAVRINPHFQRVVVGPPIKRCGAVGCTRKRNCTREPPRGRAEFLVVLIDTKGERCPHIDGVGIGR